MAERSANPDPPHVRGPGQHDLAVQPHPGSWAGRVTCSCREGPGDSFSAHYVLRMDSSISQSTLQGYWAHAGTTP